jgi:putative effector of murein hydrolase
MIGIQILRLTGVHDASSLGIAMGVAAHGVGTARALEEHPVSGAFAGLGMALTAFVSAVIIPLCVTLVE